MDLPTDAALLRIYIGEADRHDGRPLYEALVELARQRGMAGATVLRGLMGYGASSRVHTTKVLRLAEDLPLVVEIVDAPDAVEAFVQAIDGMVTGGVVTIEKVRVAAHHREPE